MAITNKHIMDKLDIVLADDIKTTRLLNRLLTTVKSISVERA